MAYSYAFYFYSGLNIFVMQTAISIMVTIAFFCCNGWVIFKNDP